MLNGRFSDGRNAKPIFNAKLSTFAKQNVFLIYLMFLFFQVCSRVVSEVGNALASLCSLWFPRLTFCSKVGCICGASCQQHNILACNEPQCLHLINLGTVSTFFYLFHKVGKKSLITSNDHFSRTYSIN